MNLVKSQVKELKDWLEGGEFPLWLETYAEVYFAAEMPHGIKTAKDGTIEEWLWDNQEEVAHAFRKDLEHDKA